VESEQHAEGLPSCALRAGGAVVETVVSVERPHQSVVKLCWGLEDVMGEAVAEEMEARRSVGVGVGGRDRLYLPQNTPKEVVLSYIERGELHKRVFWPVCTLSPQSWSRLDLDVATDFRSSISSVSLLRLFAHSC
jgi:hypothetical protein